MKDEESKETSLESERKRGIGFRCVSLKEFDDVELDGSSDVGVGRGVAKKGGNDDNIV